MEHLIVPQPRRHEFVFSGHTAKSGRIEEWIVNEAGIELVPIKAGLHAVK